jgi:hypothetical protein
MYHTFSARRHLRGANYNHDDTGNHYCGEPCTNRLPGCGKYEFLA